MALLADEKKRIIAKYQKMKGDTGSPEVQVALLTEDIKQLTEHFKEHKHDFHSRRGLIAKVNKRRKLLIYLKNRVIDRYRSLVERLKLRDIQG